MNSYINALKRYSDFRGRTNRAEFWYFQLINIIIFVILIVIDMNFGIYNWEADRGLLETLYSFFIFIPALSVGFRRVQDTGQTGWLFLIPIINLIIAMLPGQKSENKYGFDPLEIRLIPLNIRILPDMNEVSVEAELDSTIEMIIEELIESGNLSGNIQDYDAFINDEKEIRFDLEIQDLDIEQGDYLIIRPREYSEDESRPISFDPFNL